MNICFRKIGGHSYSLHVKESPKPPQLVMENKIKKPKCLHRDLSEFKKVSDVRSSKSSSEYSRKQDEASGKAVDFKCCNSQESFTTPSEFQNSEFSHLLPAVNMLEKCNFKYEVMPDSQKKHNCFFLKDKFMNAFFKYYPEYVCIDILCEITELEYSLCLFISADSNGQCEIVSVGLIKTGSIKDLSWLCEVFKKHNPNWRKIQFITCDRNTNNSETLANAFPEKLVFSSFFHSLKTMKKDLSNLDHKITAENINKTIQIFEQMICTCNESGYVELLKQMKQLPTPIVSFFRKNWHPKKDTWALGLQLNSKAFLRLFNNYLLFIRKKVRPMVNTQTSIELVIEGLHSVLSKIRREKFQKFTSVFHSAPVVNCTKPNPCHKYSKFLTYFAAELVMEQLNQSDDIKNLQKISPGKYSICGTEIVAMFTTCTCNFHRLMMLPCCHIFAVRSNLSLPLFLDTLCSFHWLASNYQNIYLDLQNIFILECNTYSPEVVAQKENFRTAFGLCKNLWPLLLECSNDVSLERVQIFQNLLKTWKNGLKVAVKTSEKQNYPPITNPMALEDLSTDYWQDIYGISVKDIIDSDNDFSSVSLCSENAAELL